MSAPGAKTESRARCGDQPGASLGSLDGKWGRQAPALRDCLGLQGLSIQSQGATGLPPWKAECQVCPGLPLSQHRLDEGGVQRSPHILLAEGVGLKQKLLKPTSPAPTA